MPGLLRRAMLALVVLNLALLSPLLCIFHCHLVAAGAGATRISLAPGQELFLCDHTRPVDTPGVPAPLDLRLLRALYELAPPLALVATGALLPGLPLRVAAGRLLPQIRLTPPTPPPRRAA